MSAEAKMAKLKSCVFSIIFLPQYFGKVITYVHQETNPVCEYAWQDWALRLQNI